MNIKNTYFGRVILIGKTNVGKSSLLNCFMNNKKISIVSKKYHTTQNNIIGIQTKDNYQIAFVDTPGIYKKYDIHFKNKKNGIFNTKTIKNSELILFIIDRTNWTVNEDSFLKIIEHFKKPLFLVINKTDKIKNKNILLPYIKNIYKQTHCKNIIPVSAKTGENIKLLLNLIRNTLPLSIHEYESTQITTCSSYFTISEIIREKILFYLEQDMVRTTHVKIESLKKHRNGEYKIQAIILVRHFRQKKMIIGPQGNIIKKINIFARKEIEFLYQVKIHLLLWVLVK